MLLDLVSVLLHEADAHAACDNNGQKKDPKGFEWIEWQGNHCYTKEGRLARGNAKHKFRIAR